MAEYTIKPLNMGTWGAYAALIEKHNGVWGGCWCTYFHGRTEHGERTVGDEPDFKRKMVEVGIAHAALVCDGDTVVGWAEYGSPTELPGIYHRKERDASGVEMAPHRITCFFVDRDHRRSGVARTALHGALDLIARAGGGLVESYPNVLPDGKRGNASFLHNCTPPMFERAGFTLIRRLGKNKVLMQKRVAAA